MDEFLFPEAGGALHEAIARHNPVFAYAYEAIDLAHLAYRRLSHEAARMVPGVARTRRVRNDINDDSWRFLMSIADPLVESRSIRGFFTVDGGVIMVLPDGMPVRLKKGDAEGNTSNYPTLHWHKMNWAATRTLFSAATPLEVAIQDGVVFDLVYVAAEVHGHYEQVGLRYAAADDSPFIAIEQPSADVLQRISPAAYELLQDARLKLAS